MTMFNRRKRRGIPYNMVVSDRCIYQLPLNTPTHIHPYIQIQIYIKIHTYIHTDWWKNTYRSNQLGVKVLKHCGLSVSGRLVQHLLLAIERGLSTACLLWEIAGCVCVEMQDKKISYLWHDMTPTLPIKRYISPPTLSHVHIHTYIHTYLGSLQQIISRTATTRSPTAVQILRASYPMTQRLLKPCN